MKHDAGLVAASLLVASAPALGIPTVEMTIDVSDGFSTTFNPVGTDNGNGTFNYAGMISGAGLDWIITWNFNADPDSTTDGPAYIATGYTVDNNTEGDLDFQIKTTLPLDSPIVNGTTLGSAAFGVTGFDSVLETIGAGLSMWESFVDDIESGSILDHDTQISGPIGIGSEGTDGALAAESPVSVTTSIGARVQFTLSPISEMSMTGVYAVNANLCFLLIDEDTIDNGFSQIIAAADSHNGIDACDGNDDCLPGVTCQNGFCEYTSAWLTNDDFPVLDEANPCLNWNIYFPGDEAIIPGGSVDDEGIFALPEDLPWSLDDFVTGGIIPQSELDEIPDVMPLRSQELYKLVGRTCVALVYDSDISISGYEPLLANLQGERYGLFYFTVLEVIIPGTIPESGSSADLYDLRVRVEPCGGPYGPYIIDIHDHEPDSIQVKSAVWNNGTLAVSASAPSDFPDDSIMTVSVHGHFFEAPMTYNADTGCYEFEVDIEDDVSGVALMISTDHGGSDNVNISSPLHQLFQQLMNAPIAH